MERDRYFGDVCYAVWWRGGNPDTVDYDRAMRACEDDIEAESHAARLMRERRSSREDEAYRAAEYEEYILRCQQEAAEQAALAATNAQAPNHPGSEAGDSPSA